ncbi:hypothetical protein [Serratia fonticola]|uniref:hypothetical protein n=1 Tax=Serratia fonticola TaxID=47917 RepID=UPI0024DE1EFE|nr:hypothetical protein [Serratia fonticola]MDK2375272.1 hypothetical protein [Serratia fonticola]
MKKQPLVSVPSGMFKNASAHSFFPDASELQSINANLFEAATPCFRHHLAEQQYSAEEPKSDL